MGTVKRNLKVAVDQDIYEYIRRKMPWLGNDSLEDFVSEAVSLRVQALLLLI